MSEQTETAAEILQPPVAPPSNQPDPAVELATLRERLATLEAAKADTDRRAVEVDRSAKVVAAKSRAVVKHLAADFELEQFLPHTDDVATLEAAATRLAQKLRAIRPDFGGVSKDGGSVPFNTSRPNITATSASSLILEGLKSQSRR